MKVLAIVLLCAFAAVQGRSAVKVVDNSSSEVALDNNPWVVHLRYAIRTSGLLQTVTGSLITSRWVLTVNSIADASFIWSRLGVDNVISPALVIESSSVQSQGPIALLNLNRDVESSVSIATISLALSSGSVTGKSCGFGLSTSGGPGENLLCSEIAVEAAESGQLIGSANDLTQFDTGAALVVNNEQCAVLVSVDEESATYVALDDHLQWISDLTGIELPSPPPQPDSSESSSDSSESGSNSSESGSNSSESEEESRVKFVNY